jgi:homoserine kinase type II
MALYTQLTKKEIQNIANDYELGTVSSYHVLSGGSENSNYLLATEKGKFVLTICEQKSIEEAKNLANILSHLNTYDFKTSKVIVNTKEQAISSYNGKPIMVKDFLDGKVTEDISADLMFLVGVELGKLHKVESPEYIQQKTCYDKELFVEVNNYAPDSEFNYWLKNTKNYIDKHINENASKALIHSDIFPSNVIISHDESNVTIMDFEEAAYYYRMFDVGMTIIGSCREKNKINHNKMSALLRGYKTEVKISTIEQQSLKAFTVYAGAAMTFWRHKNFNFTKPDPDFFDHYKELQSVTNYIKELPFKAFQ